MNLAEAKKMYLDSLISGSKSRLTYVTYRGCLDLFASKIGNDRDIAGITHTDIEKYFIDVINARATTEETSVNQ